MTSGLERDQILIEKLTKIVQANMSDENFGIMDLSRASGINHRIIRKRLKSITGKAINQFIKEVRLRDALEMINRDDLTASEVAYKTGFSSPTYFNTCFHEFFGFTPGEVKKRRLNYTDILILQKSHKPESKVLKRVWDHGLILNKRSIIYFSGLIIFSLAVYFAYRFYSQKIIPERSKEISIAVLPFKNLSNDSEDQYLVDGIMEEILTNLTGIPGLRVISRTSVEQFRNLSLSAHDIGKRLDVDYFLEGSGQKYGNNLMLRVQLIKVNMERHLWAETYNREVLDAKDIIGIQSEVAQSVADELKVNISPRQKKLIEKIPTTDLTALDFYHRGFAEVLNKNYNRAELLFKQALELDSTFSYAYSGLFMVYKDRHNYSSYYSEDYQDSLLILTNKSLSFDPNYWPGYLGRATYYNLTGKHEETIKECNKSLAINPDYWVTHKVLAETYLWNNYLADYPKAIYHFKKVAEVQRNEQLSEMLYWIGKVYGNFAGFPDTARKYFDRAFLLQNDSIMYYNSYAHFEMATGNYDRAAELALKSYSINPENKESLSILGHVFLVKREYKESIYYFRKLVEILNSAGEFQTGSMVPIGYAFLRNGFKEEAEKWFNEQKKLSEVSLKYGRRYSAWGYADLDIGIMYSLKGEKQKAYEYIRKFSKIKVCPLFLITDIKYSPIYDSLRNDAEFQHIFKDLESKYKSEHDRLKKL